MPNPVTYRRNLMLQLDKYLSKKSKNQIKEFRLEDENYNYICTFKVRPATTDNLAFSTAAANSVIKKRKTNKITEAEIKQNREKEINLYVEYIILGWKDLTDDNGDEIEFSKENCREVLKSFPVEWFEAVAEYCSDRTNFRDKEDEEDEKIDVEEVKEVVKNSKKDSSSN